VLTHYVGVQSDITELVASRKAALAARHAAQTAAAATEAKSQFLARMSHEIRTPLNGMIAVGQLLAETSLTPSQWDLVNTIRCSGESLLTLISDILDFSRAEADAVALAPAPFALQATVEAAVEIAGLLAAHKRLHVAYHISPSTPAILVGDAARLQQVLLNILNNAVKFTETGGVVLEVWVGGKGHAVEAAPSAAAAPPKPTTPAGALPPLPPPPPGALRVTFSVRDTGIGLASSDLPRLFQSFSQVDASPTRRHGGSGLGLAISQKLCQAMGGGVEVSSPGHGRGSTFTWSVLMHLPPPGALPRPALPPGAAGREASGRLLAGKRVLLAEPCGLVRAVMERALRGWGAAVAAVGSEADAIGCLLPPASGVAVVGGGGSSAPPPPPDCGLTLLREEEGELLPAPPPATTTGPFDLVIMDTGAAALLRALLHAPPSEAARVVFIGWPGRHEMETAMDGDDDFHGTLLSAATAADDASSLLTALTVAASAAAARVGGPGGGGGGGAATAAAAIAGAPGGGPRAAAAPAAAVRGGSAASAAGVSTGRRLGYTVLTRPVRQARLWVAIEEVLCAPLPPEEEGEGEGAGWPAGLGAGAGAAAAAAPPPAPASDAPASRPSALHAARAPTRSASSIDLSATEGMHRIASGGALCRAPPSRARRAGSGGGLSGHGGGASLAAAGEPPPSPSPPGSEVEDGGVMGAGAAAAAAGTDQRRAQQQPSPSIPPPTPPSGLRVLVAEDNLINMRVAIRVLARMGHTRVTLAEDGRAAVEAVEAAGGLNAFDVVLMDLHMPRMGGLEAVAALRAAYPPATCATRIVAVTADAFDHTRDACLAAGFDAWVAKPFRVEDLGAALV